jgi:[acyl-carrier-protein] S-malonyltransferase
MKFLACPGQGSQTPGFLTPWLEAYPRLKDRLDVLSQAAGVDLVELGTQADEDTIKDTSNSQPLIVGASIAVYREALATLNFDGVVGHSVGEFAAAAIAGVLEDSEAMRLVGVRGRAMAKAANVTPTSMAAVLGGEQALVLQALEALGLEPANFNGAGQIVAAGSKAAIAALLESPPEKSRVIELKVAGAFHTSYMAQAEGELAAAMDTAVISDPAMTLLSNRDGKPVQSGSEFGESLVSQVSRPVRWDLCMDTLDALQVELLELPPAGALSGLAKRGMPNSSAVALKTPADLEKIGAK